MQIRESFSLSTQFYLNSKLIMNTIGISYRTSSFAAACKVEIVLISYT